MEMHILHSPFHNFSRLILANFLSNISKCPTFFGGHQTDLCHTLLWGSKSVKNSQLPEMGHLLKKGQISAGLKGGCVIDSF